MRSFIRSSSHFRSTEHLISGATNKAIKSLSDHRLIDPHNAAPRSIHLPIPRILATVAEEVVR
jgi:hypothetical protein